MLTQTVEYALRAVVCLANHAPDPQTNDELADVTQVPPAYLAKIMLNLKRAGLVHSQRGPNGGFTLTRAPRQVPLLDVVNAVEPMQRFTECPLNIRSHGGRLCPLHRRLDDVLAAAEDAFRNTSLADVLAERGGSAPLCQDELESLVTLQSGN